MLRHYFSNVSGEYIASKNLEHVIGFTTSQKLPSVELAKNEYFAMLDENGNVNQWPDKNGCTWQIKTRFEQVTAYHKETKEPKQFDDKTLVTDDYTLEKPATQFDNWDSQLDDWVTDLQAKYEYDYQQVNSIRGSLYSQIVDRLNSEAEMIRRTEGNEAKALDYEAQADAAYIKIREDNPWPLPPEA
ncbi:MAG: hypothetical protein HWE27_15555 [Gammaproteobacteria bacterium]|nr:hypothetical protein [Gammaproteobacteria bacterium]